MIGRRRSRPRDNRPRPAPGGIPSWTLADRLAKALRAGGVTPDEMAGQLGVNARTVGGWLAGKVDPSPGQVCAWASRCGVSMAWLLTGDTGPAPDGGGLPVEGAA